MSEGFAAIGKLVAGHFLGYVSPHFGAVTMSVTQELVINMPTQTAERLKALAKARGAGSEGDIITEALAALANEADENRLIEALVATGFESETWHEVADARALLRQRFQA
jgi:predicted DNA-binding protein